MSKVKARHQQTSCTDCDYSILHLKNQVGNQIDSPQYIQWPRKLNPLLIKDTSE